MGEKGTETAGSHTTVGKSNLSERLTNRDHLRSLV